MRATIVTTMVGLLCVTLMATSGFAADSCGGGCAKLPNNSRAVAAVRLRLLALRDLYRHWRGQLDLVRRQEHRAGENLFVDYGGARDRHRRPVAASVSEAPVFVAALGASSFTYAEAREGRGSGNRSVGPTAAYLR